MKKKRPTKFDFWYAVNNTEIVSMPSRRLETFGATLLNYHMISELMDSVDQVRVREGRIHAFRPQIITPMSFTDAMLEGFGDEAERYVDWLREHAEDLRMLQYGFKIKKEEFSEHVLSGNVKAVTERVQSEVKSKEDPFSAIVRGVDNPWEVCLVKLMVEVIRTSAPANFQELERRNMFGETDGIPNTVHQEIEAAFSATARDRSMIGKLAGKLERYGLFEKYQDRFFALVRGNK